MPDYIKNSLDRVVENNIIIYPSNKDCIFLIKQLTNHHSSRMRCKTLVRFLRKIDIHTLNIG